MMFPNSMYHRVLAGFRTRFGSEPAHIVRAPGRVNLIGEHTDYNDGFVLPMAIDRATWIALSPAKDGRVALHSLDQNADMEFPVADPQRGPASWQEYPKGVAVALRDAGYPVKGWTGVSACDVPMGSGLSSSASFELAVARAFASVSGFAWDAPAMALVCHRAESQWVGVNCGIMDQLISAVGREDHAMLIDCRSLVTTAVPMIDGTSVVVLDTGTRRELATSAYNERRQQCEHAAALLGCSSLRDVTSDRFELDKGRLDPVTMRRARHVITENARTLQAAAAMKAGDAATLGGLMNQSHDSLRRDFEVTNDALNIMVEIASETAGCFGARMTGAGFGGCAMALVESAHAADFAESVTRRYASRTSLTPAVYVCKASRGAAVETSASVTERATS